MNRCWEMTIVFSMAGWSPSVYQWLSTPSVEEAAETSNSSSSLVSREAFWGAKQPEHRFGLTSNINWPIFIWSTSRVGYNWKTNEAIYPAISSLMWQILKNVPTQLLCLSMIDYHALISSLSSFLSLSPSLITQSDERTTKSDWLKMCEDKVSRKDKVLVNTATQLWRRWYLKLNQKKTKR